MPTRAEGKLTYLCQEFFGYEKDAYCLAGTDRGQYCRAD